jgi:DNA polymerase III epsilon subunit-like protein
VSASLDTVAAFFGLKREAEKHDALEDARLAAKVLAKMVERIR